MKLEFDPADPKQVESVLNMLKANNPGIWIRVNQIPNDKPLSEICDFTLGTKIILRKNNLATVRDLEQLTIENFVDLQSSSRLIAEELEKIIGKIQWKKNEDKPPSLLQMSPRTRNICKSANIKIVSDFGKFTREEFQQIRNCGQATMDEIESHLGSDIWKDEL